MYYHLYSSIFIFSFEFVRLITLFISLFTFSYARTDSELLKDIIGDVLRKLPTRYPNQVKGLVGIEENYKQIGSFVGIFNKPYKIPNEHQNTLRQIIKRF